MDTSTQDKQYKIKSQSQKITLWRGQKKWQYILLRKKKKNSTNNCHFNIWQWIRQVSVSLDWDIKDYKDCNETGCGQFTMDEANMINKKVGICMRACCVFVMVEWDDSDLSSLSVIVTARLRPPVHPVWSLLRWTALAVLLTITVPWRPRHNQSTVTTRSGGFVCF